MIHQTTVDYLCNLINIDTTINSNNQIEGILYIKEVFDKIGIENKVYEPVSGKGNIIATIKGKSAKPSAYSTNSAGNPSN